MQSCRYAIVKCLIFMLFILSSCADQNESPQKAQRSSINSGKTSDAKKPTDKKTDPSPEDQTDAGEVNLPIGEEVDTPLPDTPLPVPDPSTEPSDRGCKQIASMVTFNLKFDKGTEAAAKDVNGWKNLANPRGQRMKSILAKIKPDLMGTQEGYEHQIKDIKSFLPDHDFWGVGRDDGKAKGEYAGIFYLKSKYKRIDGGHFWLSLTPETPGTTFKGESHVRMASWVRLEDIAGKMKLFVLNTHWGLTDDSRQKSSELIVSRMKTLVKADDKVVIMGDFNAFEDKAPVLNLVKSLKLSDSYRQANPSKNKNECSAHGFTGTLEGERIDHILISDDIKVKSATIFHDKFEGLYPSDHYPVESKLCY